MLTQAIERCLSLVPHNHLDAARRTGLDAQPAAVALALIDRQLILLPFPRAEITDAFAGPAVRACLDVRFFDKFSLVAFFGAVEEITAAVVAAEADAVRLFPVVAAERARHKVFGLGLFEYLPGLLAADFVNSRAAGVLSRAEHQANVDPRPAEALFVPFAAPAVGHPKTFVWLG